MKKLVLFLLIAILMCAVSFAEAQEDVFSMITIEPENLDLGSFAEEKDYTEVSTPRSFKSGEYIVSRATVGNIYKNATPNIFQYKTKHGEIVALVVSQKQYTTYSMKMMYEETKKDAINAFKSIFQEGYAEAKLELQAESGFHNGEIVALFSQKHFENIWSLPYKTCDDYYKKLPDDILSDSEMADALFEYAKTCDFAGIVKACKNYKKEKSEIGELDQVHELLRIAEECQKLLKKCKIQYNKFDERITIYYSDIKDVSKNVSICTYYDGTFVSKIGFRNSDWVFFDTVDIVAEGMERIHLYFGNTTEQDASGSGVKEYALYNFKAEQIQQMAEAKNHEIRFSSKRNDKVLERKITKKEVEALYVIRTIVDGQKELIDMIYPFT